MLEDCSRAGAGRAAKGRRKRRQTCNSLQFLCRNRTGSRQRGAVVGCEQAVAWLDTF